MSDYKKTLNLPQTSFAMKANLTRREPETIRFWENARASEAMVAASGAKGTYVLHDGPPYANGHIHMGTAMNKILKDVIVKFQNMQGYACVYVPGWDCHGLPIEHKVEQELKSRREELPALTVRRMCREYANKWIDIQRQEFIRLGVLGDWADPYLSMKPEYEAATASNLARFVANGSVIRSKKPIYWCASCHTALAEAEVEYADVTSDSIYVAFPVRDDALKEKFPLADPARAYVVIWTTTPWTLPANQGVCLHPEYSYSLVEANGAQYLLATDRVEECARIFGWTSHATIGELPGKELEGIVATHPFYSRQSPLVLGNHVTLDSGTGCVHTAPGHGREDYEVGQKYGLPTYSPLDDGCRFTPDVEIFAGKTVWEANPEVIALLQQGGALLHGGKISHQYPHCWRCKKPVIFRATTQWFISMEANNLRQRTLKAISGDVRWIPAWGRERIYNMIESRPDWCISRQRHWGVPIVALICKHCGEAWNDPAWMREICARFATHPTGCDYWYEADVESLLPPDLKCKHCGHSEWKKETDILDVWFDSGSSFAAVLEARARLAFPADLYFEGSDQHRGWFHSSLLISEGVNNCAPYRAVLTHGYVVDGQGRKMSKSIGNVIAPQELIDRYGAEIIRLWAASVEYREDIRISDQILERLVDAYRRIRNTCRFILGNLYDLNHASLVDLGQLLSMDKYALDVALGVHERIVQAYADFDFHKVFHAIHNYCVTDLSARYLDILKYRLYVSPASSMERRSAQTALFLILRLLVRDMAPILSFTAEEIYQALPKELRGPAETVFALQPLETAGWQLPADKRSDWELLENIKGAINKAMESARQKGEVGHSLDARVTLYLGEKELQRLQQLHTDLRAAFIVSQLVLSPMDSVTATAYRDPELAGVAVGIAPALGSKCPRCWLYSEEIGTDPEWPDLCPYCASVMEAQS